MEGVFPKMNEIYLFSNECQGFIRELKAMFGLNEKTTTANLMKSVLEVAAKEVGGPGIREEEDDPEEEMENYVVM